jgi:hypothetical protein
MTQERKRPFRIVALAILWTCIVHALFVTRVLIAVPEGGLMPRSWFDLIVFFPQNTLMYCLPPKYPLDEKGIHPWELVGKLLDALPASVLYGVIIALIWNLLYRAVTRANQPAR